jgi:hypothetical protein
VGARSRSCFTRRMNIVRLAAYLAVGLAYLALGLLLALLVQSLALWLFGYLLI